MRARNIIAPGGAFETGQRQIIINPSGQFEAEMQLGKSLSPRLDGSPGLSA